MCLFERNRVLDALFRPCEAGGTLALLGLEAATGWALDPDTEALVNYAGYAALLLAGIALIARDLGNLVGR